MKHLKKEYITIPGIECIDSKKVYLIASIAVRLQKLLEKKLKIKE